MNGGFRTLVHPATAARGIDIDGTRATRDAMRERLNRKSDNYRPVTVSQTVVTDATSTRSTVVRWLWVVLRRSRQRRRWGR